MKHFGDITKLSGYDLPIVDVITGGSPCQDLSVAGQRKGMKHQDKGDEETTRSGLFIEQVRIIKEMRKAYEIRVGRTNQLVRPVRWCIWENVPGALSSGAPKGEDFRIVLEEFAKIKEPDAVIPRPEKWENAGCIMGNGWSLAWRIVDAQFLGTPQRRRRIALLCDLDGWAAPEILFDPQLRGEAENGESDKAVSDTGAESRSPVQSVPEGLRRNLGPRQAPGEGAAEGVESGSGAAISFQERAGKPGGGKGILIQDEHTGALSTLNNQSVFAPQTIPINTMVATRDTPEMRTTFGVGEPDDPQFTISAAHEHAVFLNQAPEQKAYGISPYESNAMKSKNPHSGIYEAQTSRTLDLNGGSPACNQGGMAIVMPREGNGVRESHRGPGYGDDGDPSFTLNAVERHAVAYAVDCRNGTEAAQCNASLQASASHNINSNNVVRV